MKEKVDKLLLARHIGRVQYPEWLANVMLVLKQGEKWCLCVDFTDLNKVCPKNPLPLLRIDLLVDSTTSFKVLSFKCVPRIQPDSTSARGSREC